MGYHVHWSLDSILDMEHRDRHDLVTTIAQLNQRSMDQLQRLA